MMKNWFRKNPETAQARSSKGERLDGPPRPLSGLDRVLATGFLTQAKSILRLSEQEALAVTGYLTSRLFDPAEIVVAESDS